MQPVARMADRAERKAAIAFARQRTQLDDLKEKLETMKAYRKEYERKPSLIATKASVADLKHGQAFLGQLDEAIQILEKQIRAQFHITEAEKKKWIDTWKQMNSLDKAIENFRARESRQNDRREQHQLDEQASRNR